MASLNQVVRLGPVSLRTPLVGASGTVGSAVDFVSVASPEYYGALVAKSVSPEPWPGNPPPRLAPAADGMLNSIGIQHPGISAWVSEFGSRLGEVGVPVWGSAVGHSPKDFAQVAARLEEAGVGAVEINLSCPNLDGHGLIALDPVASAQVVEAVRDAVSGPVSTKLSPNASDIVEIAGSVWEAGADWVVIGNTIWGAAIDLDTRTPRIAMGTGGYSGPPLKPISIRAVMEVATQLPGLPVLGCGGVTSGEDVVEYLLAGANAVAIGTAHFAEPRAAKRISRELAKWCRSHQVGSLSDLIGAALPGKQKV